MKGILLAGGSGTRLHPITKGVSKQLLPIYDKPMVYLRYAEQPRPEGLAQAFTIGREFIGDDRVALALGDNVFYGHGMQGVLEHAAARDSGATVFGYWVNDPERYGVVEFSADNTVVGIEEKPEKPRSHYAVTGIYFYDNRVVEIAANLSPSERGELEITDVNRVYLDSGDLHVELLGRGVAWLDTGTNAALLQASNFVETIQERQGLMIACLEEIGFRRGYLTRDDLARRGGELKNSKYGEYLLRIAQDGS
jgi:glucose-1-phosphate thymidylyltransferase